MTVQRSKRCEHLAEEFRNRLWRRIAEVCNIDRLSYGHPDKEDDRQHHGHRQSARHRQASVYRVPEVGGLLDAFDKEIARSVLFLSFVLAVRQSLENDSDKARVSLSWDADNCIPL
jgi:uncharacterized sporulation protein YeaH/YhbH (DUF444 family)